MTQGIVTFESRYAFSETVRRLTFSIESTGATLFASIDQQAAAARAGLELRPTTILMFGKPAAGTRLMAAHPIAALDLPLKILVWQELGSVHVAYVPVRHFTQPYAQPADDALIAAMDRALADIASVVAPDGADDAKDSLV